MPQKAASETLQNAAWKMPQNLALGKLEYAAFVTLQNAVLEMLQNTK